MTRVAVNPARRLASLFGEAVANVAPRTSTPTARQVWVDVFQDQNIGKHLNSMVNMALEVQTLITARHPDVVWHVDPQCQAIEEHLATSVDSSWVKYAARLKVTEGIVAFGMAGSLLDGSERVALEVRDLEAIQTRLAEVIAMVAASGELSAEDQQVVLTHLNQALGALRFEKAGSTGRFQAVMEQSLGWLFGNEALVKKLFSTDTGKVILGVYFAYSLMLGHPAQPADLYGIQPDPVVQQALDSRCVVVLELPSGEDPPALGPGEDPSDAEGLDVAGTAGD